MGQVVTSVVEGVRTTYLEDLDDEKNTPKENNKTPTKEVDDSEADEESKLNEGNSEAEPDPGNDGMGEDVPEDQRPDDESNNTPDAPDQPSPNAPEAAEEAGEVKNSNIPPGVRISLKQLLVSMKITLHHLENFMPVLVEEYFGIDLKRKEEESRHHKYDWFIKEEELKNDFSDHLEALRRLSRILKRINVAIDVVFKDMLEEGLEMADEMNKVHKFLKKCILDIEDAFSHLKDVEEPSVDTSFMPEDVAGEPSISYKRQRDWILIRDSCLALNRCIELLEELLK